MLRSIIFYSLFICLIAAGAWGLRVIIGKSDQAHPTQTVNTPNSTVTAQAPSALSVNDGQKAGRHNSSNQAPVNTQGLATVRTLLASGRFAKAAVFVNEHYSEFSAQDLEQIRSMFEDTGYDLLRSQNSDQALLLFEAQADVFDDLEAWSKISELAFIARKWRTAFDGTLKASLLQNDSIELERLQKRLINIAANLRTSLEEQGDKLGVHAIYDELYKAHPGHPRFQLELAYSYLRLMRYDEARPLLEQLGYDAALGEVSRNALEKLNSQTNQSSSDVAASSPSPGSASAGNISVPLQRLGTNLLATVQINQANVPLLLDTGASITALDTQLINQLNLRPTGQVIQISTANGIREASLYKANRVQLGRFVLSNHTVAAIDLGRTSSFKGLLGTDLLNSVNRDYAYLIDNQRGALIFKPKN